MRGASTLGFALLTLMFIGIAPGGAAETSHSFTWDTRADLGTTAARVTLTLGADADCSFGWAMGGKQGEKGGGMLFFYLEKTDDGVRETYGSTIFSAYKSHQVHAGDVDSRSPVRIADQVTLFPTGKFGASGSVSGPFPAGTYDFTVGGLGLHSTTDDPARLGYQALAFAVTCGAPITVDGFSGSHELMLFSPANMDGGVGVFESLVVHAAMGDSAQYDFVSPQVDSHVHWREYQDGGHAYGTLERTTPEGTVVYDLTDPADVRIRDSTGPGLHRYVLDRVALDFFSTMSGVAYGLGPLASLDALVPAA